MKLIENFNPDSENLTFVTLTDGSCIWVNESYSELEMQLTSAQRFGFIDLPVLWAKTNRGLKLFELTNPSAKKYVAFSDIEAIYQANEIFAISVVRSICKRENYSIPIDQNTDLYRDQGSWH